MNDFMQRLPLRIFDSMALRLTRKQKSAIMIHESTLRSYYDSRQISHRTIGKIIAVGGEGSLRNRLIDMGLIPKTTVMLRKVAPMGDPIEIRLRGYELTLRKEDASVITVEATSEVKQ